MSASIVTPLRRDVSPDEPRSTQPTAVEAMKILRALLAANNEEVPDLFQHSTFSIFHDLLEVTDPSITANSREDVDELLSTFYGLDWEDVCDYLGLDSDEDDEQFRKESLTCLNLPESVQKDMRDTIRLSVLTDVRRHTFHHVMPVVTKSLQSFGGLLYTYISDKFCLDGTTKGGFIDVMIRHQHKTILIFIIMKQSFFSDHPSLKLLAQVVAEMSGVFALNKKLSGFSFPVYAIVSDLSQFFYYCYTGNEFISLGRFDQAEKVGFDVETANAGTTSSMLSSFAPDFFSILLEGFYRYSEAMAEHLRPLGGPALIRYKAAARVTSSYQELREDSVRKQKEGRNRISKGGWNRSHYPLLRWIDVDSRGWFGERWREAELGFN
ncbi:uncharacterized protein EV420DRAFT_309664 [Desarmillaria tabescens]|uniref:Uncharacterized protein n=1 Tax=Armillaria tabescens TaxID=1929756 RepID=A0AA39N622_ARMTA|nr:uncharacterized protein EV420DRAFT_309664 [Desarmillaria tabescens]KAK0459227.1 hypothetical protein EV420DRAFT_309664 [Desarmillaria tabescens]